MYVIMKWIVSLEPKKIDGIYWNWTMISILLYGQKRDCKLSVDYSCGQFRFWFLPICQVWKSALNFSHLYRKSKIVSIMWKEQSVAAISQSAKPFLAQAKQSENLWGNLRKFLGKRGKYADHLLTLITKHWRGLSKLGTSGTYILDYIQCLNFR